MRFAAAGSARVAVSHRMLQGPDAAARQPRSGLRKKIFVPPLERKNEVF
jgi:hypothetical protein